MATTIGPESATEAGLVEAGLVALPSGAPVDRLCAAHSNVRWVVSVGDDLHATRLERDAEARRDWLPFEPAETPSRQGDRHVLQVADGWLVGFAGGGVGGGLWWFSHDGSRSYRLRVPSTGTEDWDDIFQEEYVRGFLWRGSDLLVFMGSDHMEPHQADFEGRVFRVLNTLDRRSLKQVAILDGVPLAWIYEGDRLLVVTSFSLSEVFRGGSVKELRILGLDRLDPTSIVSDGRGALYIGMRFFVLKLRSTASGWEENWFVPKGCIRTTVLTDSCECLP